MRVCPGAMVDGVKAAAAAEAMLLTTTPASGLGLPTGRSKRCGSRKAETRAPPVLAKPMVVVTAAQMAALCMYLPAWGIQISGRRVCEVACRVVVPRESVLFQRGRMWIYGYEAWIASIGPKRSKG